MSGFGGVFVAAGSAMVMKCLGVARRFLWRPERASLVERLRAS